jgi:hypothetical protein
MKRANFIENRLFLTGDGMVQFGLLKFQQVLLKFLSKTNKMEEKWQIFGRKKEKKVERSKLVKVKDGQKEP